MPAFIRRLVALAAIALAGALVCMGTMIYYNPLIFALFVGFLAAGYVFFLFTKDSRQQHAALDPI